jgi:hypothetical protein
MQGGVSANANVSSIKKKPPFRPPHFRAFVKCFYFCVFGVFSFVVSKYFRTFATAEELDTRKGRV